MTTLSVLQPGYLPWLGYFDQVNRCDIFIHYDDVQFDKNGWRNRNRIKGPNGPQWLTVPVLVKGKEQPRILDVEIDNRGPWAGKHVKTLQNLYARAPHKDPYLSALTELLSSRTWERLADLDIAVSEKMCAWLNVSARFHRSSELNIGGDRNERLVNFCRHFGATRYLSGNSAQAYLDAALFDRHGIEVEWQGFDHPVYPQLHGEFNPFLSALDAIFNLGESCRELFTQGHPETGP